MTKRTNRSKTDKYKAQAIKLEKQKDNLIASIREGVPADILRDELIKVDSELNEALLLANKNPEANVIDLNIETNYKSFIRGLTPENLGDEEKNKIRDLIACVKPMPLNGNVLAEMNIDLEGFISPDTKRPAYGIRGESSMMVAGGRDQLDLLRAEKAIKALKSNENFLDLLVTAKGLTPIKPEM